MIVKVTEQHIKKGRKNNCYSCPVALALKEARPDVSWVVDEGHIHHSQLTALHGTVRGYIVMPPAVKKFVCEFDTGFQNLAPFEFELGLSI